MTPRMLDKFSLSDRKRRTAITWNYSRILNQLKNNFKAKKSENVAKLIQINKIKKNSMHATKVSTTMQQVVQ